jgi:hypothetical protein
MNGVMTSRIGCCYPPTLWDALEVGACPRKLTLFTSSFRPKVYHNPNVGVRFWFGLTQESSICLMPLDSNGTSLSLMGFTMWSLMFAYGSSWVPSKFPRSELSSTAVLIPRDAFPSSWIDFKWVSNTKQQKGSKLGARSLTRSQAPWSTQEESKVVNNGHVRSSAHTSNSQHFKGVEGLLRFWDGTTKSDKHSIHSLKSASNQPTSWLQYYLEHL